MNTPADRLKQARTQAGLESAAETARRHGWSEQTYQSHENGTRGIRPKIAVKYGKAFGISPEWLLYGINKESGVPVVGYVGAGAEVYSYDDFSKGEGMRMVEPPPGATEKYVAVEVRGESMYPAYHPGDVLYYVAHAHEKTMIHNKDCVVRLTDGRTLIKTVSVSTSGGITLLSFNGPPITDAIIEWAAPIRFIQKG